MANGHRLVLKRKIKFLEPFEFERQLFRKQKQNFTQNPHFRRLGSLMTIVKNDGQKSISL